MTVNRGQKFGREPVRAISDPHAGLPLTDQITAAGPNEYHPLSATSVRIESVAVRGHPDNSGYIYVIEKGKDALANHGYPLSATDQIAFTIDDLKKVIVFIPAAGDTACYTAIQQGGEPA